MIRARVIVAVGLAALGLPQSLPAQRAVDLLGGGIEAYQRLDLDGAARLLRAALASDSGRGLTTNLQARGLAYLGATELFRSRPDSARAAFRRIVELDPLYRPDATVFPPQVTDLFEVVRREAHPLSVGLPPVSRFRVRSESLLVRVQGPAIAARAQARLEREDGALVRELFDGTLGDSLTLGWDGRDAMANTVPSGRYRLVVRLIGSSTSPERVARVPLTIDQLVEPATPPTPDVSPRTSSGLAWPALVAGIVAATAAATLPHAVSPGVDDSPRRLVVPVAIGTAGIVGFLLHRRASAPTVRTATPSRPPSPVAGDITLVVHAGAVAVQ